MSGCDMLITCDYRDGNIFDRTIPSFTPINHNSAQPQFVSPLKTLISRALDSDALYDLPDEDPHDVAPPEGRKRGLTQANKGRAVSLGAVWEYNDDEDLQYGVQGAGIENHTPKKRKVAPLKRAKSTKATSKTLSEYWDDGENIHSRRQHDEQQGSQLTTPPDSSKKVKKRAALSTSQSKAKKTKPFKNPAITKPSVVREKEFEDVIPSSKPVSTYQGWTTTEDAVKLNSNGITKTTLDKLAAFRYKSSADPMVLATSTNLPVECGVRSEWDEGRELQPEQQEHRNPSIEHVPFPSHALFEAAPFEPSEVQIDNGLEETEVRDPRLAHFSTDHEMLLSHSRDDFFTDALWNVKLSSQVAPSNSQNAVNLEVDEPHRNGCTTQPEFQVQQHLHPNGSIHFNHTSPQYAPGSLEISPKTAALPHKPTQHVDVSFEPTSSEARVLRCMLDPVAMDPSNQQASERSEVETPGSMQQDATTHFDQAMEIGHIQDSELFEIEEAAELSGSFPATKAYSEKLPPRTNSFGYSHQKGYLSKSLEEVQDERSDIDVVEAVPRDVSKDYESDEFDEGLDDNDLLAMVSDAAVPDTLFNLRPSGGENHGVPSQPEPIGSTISSAQDVSEPRKPVDLTLEDSSPIPAIKSHRALAPRILSPEPDDEYPMDDGEGEIFKMPELMTTGVVEKFKAPPSLQYAFGDEPGSGEVYDSALQFSPLKHRHALVSPTKVPSDLHTDKLSTGESPARRSDIELLPTGEGEDWTFIRSGYVVEDPEVQVLSEPLPDPHRRITDQTENRHCLSSPEPHSHAPYSATTTPASITQTDSASMMWMLDDSHEYKPLQPFARPDFPILILDRSPITGLCAQTFLRVCFRIGELFKEGARCEALKQDAVIELFARVTFSSREPGTTKQHFQFADLWHDRPPFPNGILANYKTAGLAESESKAFLGADEGTMARCLGRLKRDSKSGTGWMLHIITIRTTDWEEIKWTKRIVSADLVKSETTGLSKL